MYCSTNGNAVSVFNDNGGLVRKISFGGPVESAYMNGDDKVVITYSEGHPKLGPRSRYTALYETSGRLIRKTSC